jgi:hypothetical protein
VHRSCQTLESDLAGSARAENGNVIRSSWPPPSKAAIYSVIAACSAARYFRAFLHDVGFRCVLPAAKRGAAWPGTRDA